MDDYDKNKESSNRNVNNLYGFVMSQKLPVNNFKWVEITSHFSKDFMESCNEDNDEEYFPEFDVQYLEQLDGLHNDLSFLPERMKIEKVEKLGANFQENQALNHGLVLKKVHRVIKLNQEF